MNILITSVHSSKNAGDYALLMQTIHYLKEAFGDVHISILANWPDETAIQEISESVVGSPWWVIKAWDKNNRPRNQLLSLTLGMFFLFLFKIGIHNIFHKIIPQKWKDIFTIFLKTNLVVAVSGNQLFTSGKYGWPLPAIGFPFVLAKVFKKKIIIFPQSVGPLRLNIEKIFVKYLYNNVDKLYIRDLRSMSLVKDLKIQKSNPSFMPDLAFTYPISKNTYTNNILDSFGFLNSHNNIGMTIISNMPSYLSQSVMKNYYESIAKAICFLTLDMNFDIFLFCQVYGPTQDENDFLGIERVLQLLPKPKNQNLHYSSHQLNPSELKSCYGEMDLFLASRLHSGIFSLSMRVPTLFIGYLHKTIGVLEAINFENYYIKLEEVNSRKIINKILYMWEIKLELKKIIDQEISLIESDLANFPKKIRNAVANYEN